MSPGPTSRRRAGCRITRTESDGLRIALLLFGHLRLALPPARATWNEMAPAAAVGVLLLVATVAATRTRVRAPFGL